LTNGEVTQILGSPAVDCVSREIAVQQEMALALERVLAPFLDENLPGGGIDLTKSRWQKRGRGTGVGDGLLPGRADVPYLPFLVTGLYWLAEATGRAHYHDVANAQVRFMTSGVCEQTVTWALATPSR